MQGSAVDFLKEFVSKPHEIGAITQASEGLAEALASSIDWSRVEVAAEYGPGLGAVTEAILAHIGERDFFAVELNESYVESLSAKFPHVTVYRDSAANIQGILKSHGGGRIDAVVSSLPWANFPESLQDEILDATLGVLGPDAQFTTFAYIHGLFLRSGTRFRDKLEQRFRDVERSPVVWRSVPPAVVYHCQR